MHIFFKLFLIFGLLFGDVWANRPNMVFWHYQVQSINPQIAHQTCQDLYQFPYEYSLDESGLPLLHTKNSVELSHVQMIHQTHLRRHTDLVHLAVNVKMNKQELIEDVHYVQNHRLHQMKGNFVLNGMCKGQILGVETQY